MTYGVFFRHFLGEYFLTNLSIPDWNPYVLGGLPFVDSIHGATFYPLQWLDILIGGLRICVYNFMLHYLMAGIFTYLAVRQLLLSRVAAAVAGVSYMFAPCLISWVAPGHDGKIYVAALFPLAMLFLIKMFRTRPWFNATLLGLTIAAIIFTAHLQMAYYSFLAIGFYILWQRGSVWHSDRSWRSTFKPILIATYAVLLGLIISSIQLLPSYDYFSNYSLRSQQLRGLLWAGAFAIRAEELISQIVPEFSGFNKVDAPRNYWGKNSFKDNSESVGLVPILLALVGLAFGRSRQKLVWALMAFLAMIYALGPSTPFFESIIRILPFADSMRGPSSISFVFCFCAAVLAAYGVHELWFRSGRINTERYRVRAIRIILIGLPLLFAVLAGLCLPFGEQALALYCQLLHSTILPGPETDPHKWQYALNNLPSLREGFMLAALYSACFSAIVYKALTKAPLRRVWLVALVPLIMFASGSFSSQFVQLTDQTDQSSSHKSRQVVSVLKQGQVADRVIMLDLNTSHYRLANHEIQTPQGISTRQFDWYSNIAGGATCRNIRNKRFANLCGSRYIVNPRWDSLAVDKFGPLRLDTVAILDDVVVFENPNRLPRAYLVGDFLVENDRYMIGQRVLYFKEDLRSYCILDREPSIEISPDTLGTSSSDIAYYGTDSIVIKIETPTNQLLVLTDNYYPAWHAYIDGEETTIMRAYGAFRAVAVPAGSKEVVFVYDSPIYSLGKWLSILGLLIALAVLGYPRLKRLRIFSRKHGRTN